MNERKMEERREGEREGGWPDEKKGKKLCNHLIAVRFPMTGQITSGSSNCRNLISKAFAILVQFKSQLIKLCV